MYMYIYIIYIIYYIYLYIDKYCNSLEATFATTLWGRKDIPFEGAPVLGTLGKHDGQMMSDPSMQKLIHQGWEIVKEFPKMQFDVIQPLLCTLRPWC